MATRLYFSSVNLSDIQPGFAAWSRTTEGVRRFMTSNKDGSAMVTKTVWANGAAAANESALAVQFISPPMAAGIAFVTTDTFKCYIRCSESATNDNINRQPIVVKVYSADGNTLRATLKGLAHIGPNTTEWIVTTLTNKALADGDVFTAGYTTVEGDRLVVEVGAQVSSGAGTSVTGNMSFGSNSGTDLGENETDTAANNPWFESSRNLAFLSPIEERPEGWAAIKSSVVSAVETAALATVLVASQFGQLGQEQDFASIPAPTSAASSDSAFSPTIQEPATVLWAPWRFSHEGIAPIMVEGVRHPPEFSIAEKPPFIQWGTEEILPSQVAPAIVSEDSYIPPAPALELPVLSIWNTQESLPIQNIVEDGTAPQFIIVPEQIIFKGIPSTEDFAPPAPILILREDGYVPQYYPEKIKVSLFSDTETLLGIELVEPITDAVFTPLIQGDVVVVKAPWSYRDDNWVPVPALDDSSGSIFVPASFASIRTYDAAEAENLPPSAAVRLSEDVGAKFFVVPERIVLSTFGRDLVWVPRPALYEEGRQVSQPAPVKPTLTEFHSTEAFITPAPPTGLHEDVAPVLRVVALKVTIPPYSQWVEDILLGFIVTPSAPIDLEVLISPVIDLAAEVSSLIDLDALASPTIDFEASVIPED